MSAPKMHETQCDFDTLDMTAMVERVCQIARDAGAEILAVAREDLDTTSKEDGSPVTRADKAAHRCIVEGLASLSPRLPVLSEEGDLEAAHHLCASAESCWVVDPLDGTKEFVAGTGEYTVNIALVKRGQAILGVIYSPALDVLYYAALGAGSWRHDAEGIVTQMRSGGGENPLTASISRSHASARTSEFLERMGITRVIRSGSSLKMCAVAEGRADIYPRLGPTFLWDTAAGTIVARESGCRVEDLRGKDLCHDSRAEDLRHYGFIVYTPETCDAERIRQALAEPPPR